MRSPVVLAFAVLAVFAALAPGTSCARKPDPAPSPVVEKGRQVYAKYCATCHGADRQRLRGRQRALAARPPRSWSPRRTTSSARGSAADGPARRWPRSPAPSADRSIPPMSTPSSPSCAWVGPPLRALADGPVVGDARRGKLVYDANCARCHGTTTQRSSAVHLANPVLLATATDAFLHWAVERGRPPTSMVPWKGTLTPEQIDDVVAYVRSMAAPPPSRRCRPRRRAAGRAAAAAPGADRPQPARARRRSSSSRKISTCDRPGEEGARRQAAAHHRRRARPRRLAEPAHHGRDLDAVLRAKALDDIPNDGTWVLAYCACPHHVSGEVVAALRKRGYKHTAVIDEGVFAWQQRSIRSSPRPASCPPPRRRRTSLGAPRGGETKPELRIPVLRNPLTAIEQIGNHSSGAVRADTGVLNNGKGSA